MELIVRKPRRQLRILTWHIHGSYLFYLVQSPHDFYLPVKPGRPEGYAGRTESYAWPQNVHEVPAEEVRNLDFDCILFQSRKNYLTDQYEILSEEQRALPRIYLEHDPPREHPTDTRHIVDDPNVLVVDVTPFNNLMWDHGRAPSRVIDHGVIVPDGVAYTGEIERGLVIVNNLALRGRRLGADIFERVRQQIPLDLVGINAEQLGGIASKPHRELLKMVGHYRFVFNPIRYTSLGLSICEAMMIGSPIVGLATTEMATAIENGVSGYVDTNVERLIAHMRRLLADPVEARMLGRGARRKALRRFNIRRFVSDWEDAFAQVTTAAARGPDRRLQEIAYENNRSHQ
jgi:glycosyltransferase involved in cell wall biosynthesis